MSTSTPTGIGPLDWVINYTVWLGLGLLILAIAGIAFTTVIDPLVADENSLLAFILWMLGALFVASRI